MNLYYTYTPYFWPAVLMVVLLSALAVYSWHRRSVLGALPFMIGCLFAALCAAGSVMEYAAVEVEVKIFWVKFQSVWYLPVVTTMLCFFLEYAWPGRWLTRHNLACLAVAPLLILGLILTNDFHHLLWYSFKFNGAVQPQLGSGAWIVLTYAYGLVIANLLILVWLLPRSPYSRWPVAMMLLGQLGGRSVFLLERVDILHAILPIEVLGMGFEFLMYAVALFGFHIFDPIALARHTVIAQIREGMLVLDLQGRIASLNLAAEQFLQVSNRQARGRLVKELLPAYPDGQLADLDGTVFELNLGEAPDVRDFTLGISLLKDWRGLEVGRLLVLRDVTEPKRARELQKQQQLLLAALQERERLARELHDSLGQTLAAARLHASTARLLLTRGETTEADNCLEQIGEITMAAETDVREYLLGAKTAFSSSQLFFPTLRQYAARFSQQYSLPVELSVHPQLEARGLGAAVEVQLLRIIQEALSNVRKHACAKKAQVVFTDSGHEVQVTIVDDGRGFDHVATIASQQVEGFGLQAMRERAEALGGSLAVVSSPGSGTQVLVQVPIQRAAFGGEVVK